ncbi:MAG: hypothetical protein RBU29_09860 [bacterium]|jgi:hypothetical protein|nr:hypothetical protein [bacterium]
MKKTDQTPSEMGVAYAMRERLPGKLQKIFLQNVHLPKAKVYHIAACPMAYRKCVDTENT